MEIKTIDITACEWFDKTYGNSYFAAQVTINYGTDSAQTIYLPFQYGYGDHYIHMAFKALKEQGIVNIADNDSYWNYCRENNIVMRNTKHENCLLKEVKSYGLDPNHKTTRVIFRKYNDGQVIAIFPYEIADAAGNVTSYMHIGQHSAASLDIIRSTKAAGADEYKDLMTELKSIGYDLIVNKRVNHNDYNYEYNKVKENNKA
jgi:hypothetical protein